DASVPFEFDVHAMVFSSDAPALERKLHELLEANRVNKVNPRKEFFRVPISEIKQALEESGYTVQWTLRAEAAEYRESCRLEKYADGLLEVSGQQP
ncbi:MAG: GIY-YIG nuclease family protein, partial [Leptolyngbya sp.]|nr:GIY-YIG nuclease family protein [Leptolyngbya sp.]